MIAIVNIGESVRHSGPHKYELRINRTPIATFYHNREEPLYELLLKAAIAAEEKDTDKPDPFHDRAFFEILADNLNAPSIIEYLKGEE